MSSLFLTTDASVTIAAHSVVAGHSNKKTVHINNIKMLLNNTNTNCSCV